MKKIEIPYWRYKRLEICIAWWYNELKLIITPIYQEPELFDRGYEDEWFYHTFKQWTIYRRKSK